MEKKKKIIIASIATIVVIALIGGLVWFLVANQQKNENGPSKISKLYDQLLTKESYSFSTVLDNRNQMQYAKQKDQAYINTTYEGEESKFILKDGNTYLIQDQNKKYYIYRNNQTDLNKMEVILDSLKDKTTVKGKEKIENKNYSYEEYEGTTDFLIKGLENVNEETAKTRFYFNGDQLAYIKTIVGEYQEQLKVTISNQIEDSFFQIPSDYQEV